MDFFDFVNELRHGEPDAEKAAQAMKYLGWLSFVGGLWNYTLYFVAPLDKAPFKLPPAFPYIALSSLFFLGALFLYSSQAIRKMTPFGKKVGQAAVILLSAILIAFLYFVFPLEKLPFGGHDFSIFPIIFFGLFLAQFGVPAYYGVRYLERLPALKSDAEKERFHAENVIKVFDRGQSRDNSGAGEKYIDALFPLSVFGTFALFLAVLLIAFFATVGSGYPEQTAFLFMPTFFFIFFAPIAYNYFPSPFQKHKHLIASFTGGGSVLFFGGTWPFFRLLIYNDGLEVRVMFHRFFIPYDQLDEISQNFGFFSRGLLIKTTLPGVPAVIRYHGFGMKRIVEVVNRTKAEFTHKS